MLAVESRAMGHTGTFPAYKVEKKEEEFILNLNRYFFYHNKVGTG